ncbi:GAF and ANTAR domain-containing protein [Gryllotalpicola daejeonensis]|uniref:GAF and ANTAR domain-containing protein n=1 Tax=Gryllotalpicola daejeonensis TaxID=993087 RepID=A0ABP7ZMW8_9MICO
MTLDDDSFDDSFADVADELYALGDAARVAEAIARIGREAVGCDMAVVSFVASGRRLQPAAGTSREAFRAVELQGALGEGPGRTAVHSCSTEGSDDLGKESRWPLWASAAADLGVRSSLAVPLHEGGRVFAVLHLYSEHPGTFDAAKISLARRLARRSSLALAAVRRTDHLKKAVDARTVIGQAEGILMERYNLDADTAFSVLRRHSQQGNLKLHDVAQTVVRERSLPGLDLAVSAS